MTARGIEIVRGVKVREVRSGEVIAETKDGGRSYPADAVLVATGRRANTAALNLAAAGVELNARGEIAVDEHLKTSQDHIYAMTRAR